MIVLDKRRNQVVIVLPMGAKAREILDKLRELGLEFEEKTIFCG